MGMRTNIGHRLGGTSPDSDNTLKAAIARFEETGNRQFKYWETDVRESIDGQLFCYHDDRIGDDDLCGMRWDEISKSGESRGIKIPLLIDVVSLLGDRDHTPMIEIKYLQSDKGRQLILDIASSRQDWNLMATPKRFKMSFPGESLLDWAQKFQDQGETIVRVGRHHVNLFRASASVIGWWYAQPVWCFGL